MMEPQGNPSALDESIYLSHKGHRGREGWQCPFSDDSCPKSFLPTKLYSNEDTGVFLK